MVRGTRFICVLVFAAACGGPSHISDAAADTGDAATDAASADAADAAADAASFDGLPCVGDADCGPASAERACEPNGLCGPAYCSTWPGRECPGALWCVRGRCALPSCGACREGMVCAPARGECVAAADPVACRASGGLYVRGRCMRAGQGDDLCEGGFGAEVVGEGCELYSVSGRSGGVSLPEGPYPVARVVAPVAGTLSTRVDASDRPNASRWSFAYVDGGEAMNAKIDVYTHVVDDRAYGCIAAVDPDFAPGRLCSTVSAESAFRCGGLAVEALSLAGFEREDIWLALAGRDEVGRLHVETLHRGFHSSHLALVHAFTSDAASGVWPPLVLDPAIYDGVWFRVGPAAPLALAHLDDRGPPELWPHAGLSAGEEFSAWIPRRVLGRSEAGELLSFTRGELPPEVLLPAPGAPVGRYHASALDSERATLVAHESLPLPSTLATYDINSRSPGPVSVERIAELPNVGLYAGNYASPQPDGTYVVRRGGRGRTTLIGPADVGGEILAVTDMTIAADSLGCGLEGNLVGHSLMGAMLTIRLADGNVIHELWAAGEQSR